MKSNEVLSKIRTKLGSSAQDVRQISDSLSEIYINHLEHTEEQNLNDRLKNDNRNCYQSLKDLLVFMEQNMETEA